MNKKVKFKRRIKLGKSKITLDRVGQIVFTLREITKLAFKIKPNLLVAVFVFNAIWGLTTVPGFYLNKLIIDKLIESIGTDDIRPIIIFVSWIILASISLQFARTFISSYNSFLRRTLSRYFDTDLHIMIANKLAQLDLATIESPEFRDRFDKVEKESSRRAWGLMMPLSNIPNYMAGFVSSALIIILIHPAVAIVLALVSLPQILVDSKYIKKDYKLVTELSSKRRMWGWLSNYLIRNRNFMEMKLLNLSGYLSKKLKTVAHEVLESRVALSRKRVVSRVVSFLPMSILEIAVSVLLSFWVIIEKITIGTLQLYLQSLRSAQSNLAGLASSFTEIYENYVYVIDLVWLLNLEPDIENSSEKDKDEVFNVGSIKFDNVHFRYREDSSWILKGVDFDIKSGEKIALVGENGAGKSTLIKLIARFYDPNKGKVLVSENNLIEMRLSSWRKKLAILFQMFELYPFSAREAIGYGDITRLKKIDEIKKVAKKTGIDEFIEGLPKKYENPITPEFDKGVRPSIGQWQRFGISRMLFRKGAEVIILDEPTSNIDPEAEEKIFAELKKLTKDKILIFVTQRFSTVKIADRIFVMDKGKIIEKGTHKELMKRGGKYVRMFNVQAEAYFEKEH